MVVKKKKRKNRHGDAWRTKKEKETKPRENQYTGKLPKSSYIQGTLKTGSDVNGKKK